MTAKERQLPFGKIEPNSAKYFLSCTLGGIIGKYCIHATLCQSYADAVVFMFEACGKCWIGILAGILPLIIYPIRTYAYSSYTPRPGQMSSPGRPQHLHLQSLRVAPDLL
jgi:hypothetical protein